MSSIEEEHPVSDIETENEFDENQLTYWWFNNADDASEHIIRHMEELYESHILMILSRVPQEPTPTQARLYNLAKEQWRTQGMDMNLMEKSFLVEMLGVVLREVVALREEK